MARLARAFKPFQHGKRIAFYFATGGEMDPNLLIAHAREVKKQCYFPVLRDRPSRSMWFAELKPEGRTEPNRFNIQEPAQYHRHIVMPWGLDLIFLPLVAFDLHGNRLGMGGGFYDRTLAYRQHRTFWKGPRLIGLAHEFQRVDELPRKAWDIPLDGVITEKSIYLFRTSG